MAISYVQTAAWNTAGTGGTGGSFKDLTIGTLAVGDVVLVYGVSSNYTVSGTGRSISTQSASTAVVTWSNVVNPASVLNNDVDFTFARGVVTTAGNLIARVQLRTSGSDQQGAGAWIIPAAEVGASDGALGSSFAGVGTNLVSRTVAVADSRVWYMMGDWNAVITAATTGTPSTNVTYGTRVQVAGQHSVWSAIWENQATGTRNYGMAGSAGLDATGFVYTMAPAPSGGITATATSAFGQLGQAASAATVPPNFTTTATSTFGQLSQAASASTVPPAFTATAASAFGQLSQAATASTGAPAFSATAASAFGPLSQSASATRTVPAFTATAASAFGQLSQAATATRTVPAFTAAATSNFGALTQAAAAASTPPGGVSATVSSTFGQLAQSATATRTIPPATATASSTFGQLSQSASATRTVPAFTATANSAFGQLSQSASATRTTPAYTGVIASGFSSLTQAAAAVFSEPSSLRLGQFDVLPGSFTPGLTSTPHAPSFSTAGGDIPFASRGDFSFIAGGSP